MTKTKNFHFFRYAWLVELLTNVGEASFEEIADAWEDDDFMNPSHEPLSKDTFNKHKAAIADFFGIEIKNRIKTQDSVKNYKYYVVASRDDAMAGRMRTMLLALLKNIQVEHNAPLNDHSPFSWFIA